MVVVVEFKEKWKEEVALGVKEWQEEVVKEEVVVVMVKEWEEDEEEVVEG